MSGGYFDYGQTHMLNIISELEDSIDTREYREDVLKIMKDGVDSLKKAYIYARRLDWYLSGDDNEDSLIERLKRDLENPDETKYFW